MLFFFFSQSYEIGKMNVKYAPGSDIQVRQCLQQLVATVL